MWQFLMCRTSHENVNFISDSIQKIILDCTNLEGRRVCGERWKEMGQTYLHALGFSSSLEFSGFEGESTETGRQLFHATMSLENLHIISRINRFDNQDDNQARKLAAIRTVWDKCL